jgi:hypothetical protein
MSDMQRAVVLLSLIEQLRQRGSWCGETHIQKSTYFLQELLGVPLAFDFILYKHGPFSFDLNDEITALQADFLLALKSRPPYGPSMIPGEGSEALLGRYPKTRNQYRRQVEFVADRVGRKNVAELERLATAFYVSRNELPEATVAERAQRIIEIKPHISYPEAHAAVQEVDRVLADARSMSSSSS